MKYTLRYSDGWGKEYDFTVVKYDRCAAKAIKRRLNRRMKSDFVCTLVIRKPNGYCVTKHLPI